MADRDVYVGYPEGVKPRKKKKAKSRKPSLFGVPLKKKKQGKTLSRKSRIRLL